MLIIKSTAEILALRMLNKSVDHVWIDWAVEMLVEGFTSESLLLLAGQNKDADPFELQKLGYNALDELGLDYSDEEKVIDDYVCYLIEKAISGKQSYTSVLGILKKLYVESHYSYSSLHEFYALYLAQEDLKSEQHQYYWDHANRENIDQIIKDYFYKRKNDCGQANDMVKE